MTNLDACRLGQNGCTELLAVDTKYAILTIEIGDSMGIETSEFERLPTAHSLNLSSEYGSV